MKYKLTTKQKLFVEAYLTRPNAVAAAKSAGYKGNYNTLKQVGAENLSKPYIAKEIKDRIQQAVMSADEVLAELSRIARSPLYEHLEVSEDPKKCITVKLRLGDKIRALELIAKHHRLFSENNSDVRSNELSRKQQKVWLSSEIEWYAKTLNLPFDEAKEKYIEIVKDVPGIIGLIEELGYE